MVADRDEDCSTTRVSSPGVLAHPAPIGYRACRVQLWIRSKGVEQCFMGEWVLISVPSRSLTSGGFVSSVFIPRPTIFRNVERFRSVELEPHLRPVTLHTPKPCVALCLVVSTDASWTGRVDLLQWCAAAAQTSVRPPLADRGPVNGSRWTARAGRSRFQYPWYVASPGSAPPEAKNSCCRSH